MEEQHALGQLSVVQSFLLQHVGGYGLILSGGDELLDAFPLVLAADGVEGVVEGKLLDVGKVLLLEVGGGHVVVGIDEGEHVLEHAAGGSRCGYELHHLLAFGLVLQPGFYVLLALGLAWSYDAVAHGGGCLELQEGESGLKLIQLCLNLLLADSALSNLFQVLLC